MKYAYKLLKMFTLIIFMVPGIVYAQAIKDSILKNYTQEDYEEFVKREMRGEIPDASGPVPSMRAVNDILVNNNGGATGTGLFTQSETSILAFGSTVLVGFNDSGSRDGGANKFTGWSYSTDGGATFMDGGTLPTSTIGDAGDPVFARDESTGRIYYTTLGFSSPNTIQVFASDDNGVTWDAPVVGTPGGTNEDKQWIAVDNFAGSGNGNVYLISRRFAGDQGIYVFTSTDNGATFGPDGGVKIVNSTGAGDNKQGAFIAVGTDHSVYAFWMDDVTNDLNVRKSTDFGATFGATVTFVTGLAGTQVNNGLNLTGQRQGSASFSGFRSNSFPHVAVNPVSGHLYLVYNDNPAGDDKGNIYMVMSDDGAATWSAPVQINDDGTTTDQWQPTIAVTPDGNNLGIFYYSREEDATDNNLFTYNGRKASISGSTVNFSSSFVISELQSLPEFGRDNQVNSTYMGDYNCASATNNIYHVVWSDNRDDLDETGAGNRKDPNVYYKAVPVGSGSPVAACQSVSIAADENCQAMVTAEDVDDGSFHPDGIPVTLSLSPEGPYELGVTNVTLTVDDGFGGVATCNTTITVNDETAPVAPPAPADVNVECKTDVPAQVDLTATDNCDGDITVSPTSVVTPGSSGCPNDYVEVRTWTFTDAAGNSSSVSQTITVLDVTPPVLTAISDPIVLRPPNHKYSTISLSDVVQSVTDNCEELTIDDVHITSVSSDEVENAMGDGDGNTWDDILFTGNDCSSVDLRRERQGGGNGRVYTVNLSVSDCVGNTATASAEVHIPHDDDDEYAVNDGTTYSNYSVDCNKSRLVSFTEEDILLTNYPNPFSGTTTIKFMIDETKYTTLKVYDIYGKLVATLFDDQAQAGKQYAFPFKAGNDASGIYFYHLKSGNDISAVQKMILMK